MYRPSGKVITLGTAVMTLCLGLPIMSQAGSSFDTRDNRDRTNSTQAGWSDAWGGDYASRYNEDNNSQYYTNQYGDLDTIRDQERVGRNQSDGYWNSEGEWTRGGYRSNVPSKNPQYPNDLRRADEDIRQDIIRELGGGTERVHVTVRNGVASLTGMVLNRAAMVEAVEDAYDGGARKVRNRLQLFRHEERPWAEMSDRSLAKAVRGEISWSPFVDGDPIRVEARQGVVTLQGSVENRSEMAAAVDNAYEAGARRVNNQLRIQN